MRVLSNQNRNDKMRDEHDQATPKEQRTSADAVHAPKRACYTHELDTVEYTRHDELHVVFKAHGLEKRRRIVNESIDTHELDKVLIVSL